MIKSSILDKYIILIDLGDILSLLNFEINIFENPNFSASVILCSNLWTGLISPESPTSAAKQYFSFKTISSLDDITAATTARSSAVSSTEIPPVIFKNTSFEASLNPTLFSNYTIWISIIS